MSEQAQIHAKRAAASKVWFGAVLILAGAMALGWLLPRNLPLLDSAEMRTRDMRLAGLSRPEPQHPDIVIATITEGTLARLPYRAPLDRAFLAGVLDRLDKAGARAVAMDILFDQPTEPEKDKAFFDRLAAMHTPVVTAWAGTEDGLTPAQAAYLAEHTRTAGHGLVNIVTDGGDGVVRRVFPGAPRDGAWMPGFAWAIARAAGQTVPDRAAEMPIAYRAPPPDGNRAFRAFPAHTLAFLPDAWLKDKIVLIGAELAQEDRHKTPAIATNRAPANGIPGVVIHAHAVAQILDGRHAPETPPLWEVLALLVTAGLGLALSALNLPAVLKVVLTAVAAVGCWVGGFYLYGASGLMLPLVGPSLALLAASGAGLAWLGRRERHQKAFIRAAFSQFTSPTVVDDLVQNPARLRLGGERRELTFVFSDLAGFTSLIEKADPEDMLPRLNAYLEGMCRIVFDHGGTMDKIVGDALHVIFGAPGDQPDHARRAMACAMDLDAFARRYVADQQAQGVDFGGTRIGVHSGPAVVGNFGGGPFFDYTAHGDAINTAARLESANKFFGTMVCASIATAGQCPDMPFRPIGAVILKGKTEGLQVMEPVAHLPQEQVAAYREAYDRLESDPEGALSRFRELVARHPDDMLSAMHIDRLTSGDTGTTIVMRSK
ncbi:MAG: adenylate/guanylate cyclase domain-containing protein [Rhodobacterales bacterium]|nr:adenylate/guanylate cyclase domain-containing protein [Rhodobacterales bacterium]